MTSTRSGHRAGGAARRGGTRPAVRADRAAGAELAAGPGQPAVVEQVANAGRVADAGRVEGTAQVERAGRVEGAERALAGAVQHLCSLQDAEGWWKGELQTNVTMDAEDLLLREFLGIRQPAETAEAARWIRSQQRVDGSWATFHGGPADLSTTVEAWVALRLAGDPADAPHLRRAERVIHALGGLERTRVFTRIWLALFGLWPWDELPELPPELVLLPPWMPLNVYDFACWARQTVVPLTVVASFRPVRPLPFGVDELRTGAPAPAFDLPWTWTGFFQRLDLVLRRYGRRPVRGLRRLALRRAENWILARQEADGSWGGIQPPWVYSLLALHLLGHPVDSPAIRAGLRGLDRFTIREPAAGGPAAGGPAAGGPDTGGPDTGGPDTGGTDARGADAGGQDVSGPDVAGADAGGPAAGSPDEGGPVAGVGGPDGCDPAAGGPDLCRPDPGGTVRRLEACQSPVWDTGLAVIALLDAGVPADDPAVLRAADWLLAEEITVTGDWAVRRPGLAPGGWAFEFDNDGYPDTDDTAEVVLALRRVAHPEPEWVRAAVHRGMAWTRGMRSRDGGWGAFDADNTSQLPLKLPFCDFGAVTDPPSADVTAHVVEMLAAEGLAHTADCRGGVRWLLSAQEADGSWFGRWGANHVYGTGAAVPALVAAGVSTVHPAVRRAVGWLESVQNGDGGWGEDLRSYRDRKWVGRGESTASQTAWALLALLAAGERSAAVDRGVAWLVGTQRADGTWDEPQFTGTGFPGDFYLNYHLYRLVFPVSALGRYLGVQPWAQSGTRP